jgi:hypothetical protein
MHSANANERAGHASGEVVSARMRELTSVPSAKTFITTGKGSKKTIQGRRPTPKQIKAVQLLVENGGLDKPKPTGDILREAGYSEAIASTPAKVIDSPVIQDLLNQFMPDNLLAETHRRLLTTRKIEHMVFPLEYQDPSDLSHAFPVDEAQREQEIQERRIIDNLSDEDIIDMLSEVGCKVKRIIHGDTARHVYYWAHDAKSQANALELAYKMKGYLSKDDKGATNLNFNFGMQSFVKNGESDV